jgi:hypothetical protein
MGLDIMNHLPHELLVRMRQAFYSGVEQVCLKSAWSRLDEHRQNQWLVRLFRGEQKNRKGIPLSFVALSLGRSTGEVSRWFNSERPCWANLVMAMTALNTTWKHLGDLPPKADRKASGIAAAMVCIREEKHGYQEGAIVQPAIQDIQYLFLLWKQDEWPVQRRCERYRICGLNRVAGEYGVPIEMLDRVDRDWGNEFGVIVKWLEESMDWETWQ